MMNGPEKSDPAIVAGKPTNKAERSAAELVERRAGTKGNAGQSSTRWTQSRIYTTRDHDCISNRIGSGIRTCPQCGSRLATFVALPAPSTIYREIIVLNNHRFWGHSSGPSSSSGKTLSSFHPLLARPCRSALPRERFSPMALFGHPGASNGCLLLRVERKCRASGDTSVFDPGCVKTCPSQGRLELFSQLPFFRQKLPMQPVFTSTKSRWKFYAQVRRGSFHTAWTRCGSRVGQNAVMHNTAFRRRGKVCDPRMKGMPMRRREF